MIPQVVKIVRKEIESIKRRILGIVSRGTVRVVNDTTNTQTVQMELPNGEVTFNIPNLQPFGFSSVPLAGADGVHLCIGSNRNNSVAVSVNDHRYRPKNNIPGTVCLHTQNAVLVRCLPDGTVEIGEEPSEFAARADKVASEINAVISSLNDLIDAYNSHKHVVVVDEESPSGFGTEATVSLAVNATDTTASANACEKVKAK